LALFRIALQVDAAESTEDLPCEIGRCDQWDCSEPEGVLSPLRQMSFPWQQVRVKLKAGEKKQYGGASAGAAPHLPPSRALLGGPGPGHDEEEGDEKAQQKLLGQSG